MDFTIPYHELVQLKALSDHLVQHKMERLKSTEVYVIYTEVKVPTIMHLNWLVRDIIRGCNRIVILVTRSEFTYLAMTRSSNLSFINADLIINNIISNYGGQSYGTCSHAYAIFNRDNQLPEILDYALESAIIAVP